MKKTSTKTKSPAPATSSTAKSTRKKATTETAAKATPAAVPLTATPAASPVPLPVPKTSASVPTIITDVAASAVKAVAPAKVQTKIVAKADVGFGNALYIRGDGPGLSWNQGVAMECVNSDQWEITLSESSQPVSFKVLLNDTTWCTGPDAVVASGSTTTVTPEFA